MGVAGSRDHDRPPRPRALRRYGQNHLVDANTLRVILGMAAVRPDDVVLEVGAAGGLLTERLAEQARAVHAFEVDGRFAAVLEGLAAKRPSIDLHLRDALKTRLDELTPEPTILVANLAYNIAIPLIVETAGHLPGLDRWAVMVQKELEERLFAAPRVKAYSAVSVLVQLACERTGAASGAAHRLLARAARRLGLRHLQTAAGGASRGLRGRGEAGAPRLRPAAQDAGELADRRGARRRRARRATTCAAPSRPWA